MRHTSICHPSQRYPGRSRSKKPYTPVPRRAKAKLRHLILSSWEAEGERVQKEKREKVTWINEGLFKMGRGRVQPRRIENKINRQVTFSKRRNGLMKKASELSILCNAEVALIVLSNRGKLYEFSSSSMTKILERHRRCSNLTQDTSGDTQHSNFEVTKLKETVESLERRRRHLLGDDLDPLGLKELQQLEQQLQKGLKEVESKKSQFLFDMIHELRRKEQLLEGMNKSLQKKISEMEGQSPCDPYPIQLMGGSWHSVSGNYDTDVHSSHCESTLNIGCPFAPTGNTTAGRRQSGNYDARAWIV